jgi:hypothetical protein
VKISTTPLSLPEPRSAVAGGSGDGEYNRMFEDAIRDAAKEPPPRSDLPANDLAAKRAAYDKETDAASRSATRSAASRDQTKARADKDADSATSEASDTATADEAEAQVDRLGAIAALDRFLKGDFSGVAPAANAKSALPAGADDSRAVDADAHPAVAAWNVDAAETMADPLAVKARGKVSLEVVHMETHFEPRSDAFVLVEGEAEAAVKLGTAQERLAAALRPAEAGVGTLLANAGDTEAAPVIAATADREQPAKADRPKLSFEETLARIDTSRASGDGSTGDGPAGGEKRGRGSLFAEARNDRQAQTGARAAAPAVAAKSDDGAAPTLSFPSMTGQVANRVIDALGSTLTAQRAPDAAPGDAYVRLTAGGAALKTLTIQLQPEELGRLDVSMRLVEGQLTLEIAASEAGTAKILAEDREGLRKLLQHAGFSIDDTAITIVTRDAGSVPARTSAADAPGQAGARTSSGGDSPAGDGAAPHSRQDRESGGGEGRQDNRRQTADERARASLKAASTYL